MAGCGCNCSESASDPDVPYLVKESKGNSELAKILSLRHAITSGIETAGLTRILDKISPTNAEIWKDDNDYDLMHYAILSNNQEAVLLFFTRGLFRGNYLPSLPYLHLACEVGLRTVTGFILDARPKDDVALVYDHGEFPIHAKSVGGNNKAFFVRNRMNKHRKEIYMRPIDVAAEMGHIHCTRFLLDMFDRNTTMGRKKEPLGHLAIAAKLGSPSTLKLLFAYDNFSDEEILRATEISIREVQPRCLDLLLAECGDTSSLYSGMNLFHVLYQYPLNLDEDRLALYPDATEVLIKHGYDINACFPGRTFPLYSLLSRQDLYTPGDPILYKSLKKLILAGADPNHDEPEHEVEHQGGAIGRKAYPSALFCLFHTAHSLVGTLSSEETSVISNIRNAVFLCAKYLLQNKANARKIARVYQLFGESEERDMTVFHEYMRCASTLSVNPVVYSQLFQHGVDPMAKFKGMLPLTTYSVGRNKLSIEMEEACPLMSEQEAEADVTILMTICDLMDFKHIRKCKSNLAKKRPKTKTTRQLQHALDGYLSTVRTLKQECASRIWQCCGRLAKNIEELDLPQRVKTDIIPVTPLLGS